MTPSKTPSAIMQFQHKHFQLPNHNFNNFAKLNRSFLMHNFPSDFAKATNTFMYEFPAFGFVRAALKTFLKVLHQNL